MKKGTTLYAKAILKKKRMECIINKTHLKPIPIIFQMKTIMVVKINNII